MTGATDFDIATLRARRTNKWHKFPPNVLPAWVADMDIDGAFEEGGEHFVPQSWLRLPPQGRLSATVGRDGCTLWVKTGHLRHIQVPPRAGD